VEGGRGVDRPPSLVGIGYTPEPGDVPGVRYPDRRDQASHLKWPQSEQGHTARLTFGSSSGPVERLSGQRLQDGLSFPSALGFGQGRSSVLDRATTQYLVGEPGKVRSEFEHPSDTLPIHGSTLPSHGAEATEPMFPIGLDVVNVWINSVARGFGGRGLFT
jgi:hypothetical protein